MPHPATHFQTDFIRTIKWTQKCIRFDQKSKLPANTDSILYTENLLEISLWSKQGCYFWSAGGQDWTANQGTLREVWILHFEGWVRSPLDFHFASLGNQAGLSLLLQGSLSEVEPCVKVSGLCFVVLVRTVWLWQQAGECPSASLGSTTLCVLLTFNKHDDFNWFSSSSKKWEVIMNKK